MKIGWLGKNGVQDTNLLDRFISVLGCLKSVQNSSFRSRPAIFPVFPSPGADTSSIQEVSSLRTQRSSISLFGPTVRNVPKSVNFFETDGR